MTWVYNAAFLSSSSAVTANFTSVRLMIGDTDTARQQLQDEEIYWVLSGIPQPTYAAATCAEMLASKYAFLVNTENSELRVSAAARHGHYLKMAARLRAAGPGLIPGVDGDTVLGGIYVGGAVQADVDALSDNTSYRESPFAVGQDDIGSVADVDGFGD